MDKNTKTKEDAIKYFLQKNPTVTYENGDFIFDGTSRLWMEAPYSLESGKLYYYFEPIGYVLNAEVCLNEDNNKDYEEEEEVHYNLN